MDGPSPIHLVEADGGTHVAGEGERDQRRHQHAASACEASAMARVATHTAKRMARKLKDAVPGDVLDDIYRCATKRQVGVSLKYMLDFGAFPIERQMLVSAQFLHKELPVRLAHRVVEVDNLPLGLCTKPPVAKVRDWYIESFRELREFPEVKDMNDEAKLTDLLRKIKTRHNNVVPMMALGVNMLKKELNAEDEEGLGKLPEIHQFLDGFYMSRIGIRMLIGQHISLHEPPREDYIGLICKKVCPVRVAEEAIEDARSICYREYGDAPDVQIYGNSGFTFAYVPEHLHHMLFELIKNSLRAVQDRFVDDMERIAPPIRIIVAEGEEDVTIKVSDEGGGIPRSGMPKIWTYLYSTAKFPAINLMDEEDIGSGPSVLAGYGYGLPISRLYARYFGGDLQIISMEGYGTDAYLHVNRLADGQEPLP